MGGDSEGKEPIRGLLMTRFPLWATGEPWEAVQSPPQSVPAEEAGYPSTVLSVTGGAAPGHLSSDLASLLQESRLQAGSEKMPGCRGAASVKKTESGIGNMYITLGSVPG